MGWSLLVCLAVAWLTLWGLHTFKSTYLTLATGIQDDTYYYLLPAWNFARVGSFTFDGLTSSYGFQPLWELWLVVIAYFANSREMFLRVALFVGAMVYAATALAAGRAAHLVWRNATHKGGELALVVTGALLLLNTPVQLSNLTGKENALYGLLFATLLNLHLHDRINRWPGFPIVSGAVAGLILLVRLSPISLAVVALQPVPGAQASTRCPLHSEIHHRGDAHVNAVADLREAGLRIRTAARLDRLKIRRGLGIDC